MTYAKLIPQLAKRNLDVVKIQGTYHLKIFGESGQVSKNLHLQKFLAYDEIEAFLLDHPRFTGKTISKQSLDKT